MKNSVFTLIHERENRSEWKSNFSNIRETDIKLKEDPHSTKVDEEILAKGLKGKSNS